MKHFKRHLKVLFASFIYIFSAGFPAVAEDIEIFFGNGSSVSGLIKPNVLFVLDTSGSMTSIVADGQGKSRLTHMKEALTDIISDANNVNMGLMRFTKPGGPILFPVANVDAALSDIESSTVASSVVVALSSSTDDAEENSAGDVLLDSPMLELVEVTTGGGVGGSIEVRVSASNDDAEERANGNMYRNSSDLELIQDGSDQIVGVRFRNIAIPQGATITSAEIEFEIDQYQSRSTSLNIKGEANDDAPGFSSSNGNISSRSTTTNEVAWPNVPVKSRNELLTTPDLSPIIQEIVNRPGWSSGNDMVFVISGSGKREVESYDGEPDAAPLLRVTFSGTGPAVTDTQMVGLRFAGVNVPQGVRIDSATLEFSTAATSSDAASLTIYGQDDDNASTFSATGNDISSRATTTASAAWNTIPAWSSVDETHTSVNLSSVVQEIVNRTGWCGGNAMVFIVSGSGSRIAHAFDAGGSGAPVLRINYDENTIPASGGCMSQVMTRRVSNGNDDVEESSSGAVNNSSSDLELVRDGSNQTIGIRFQDIQIPKDAEILSAVLNFEIDEQYSESTSLTIRGEAHDDAVAYNTADSGNVSNRSTTAASVAWNSLPNLSVNTKLTSPDLSAIISEITSRSGWIAGNAMSFVITGSGRRTVESYNGEAGAAPQLVVMYRGDGGGTEKTVRDRLVELVNELQHKGGTPIVDSLYEAALYYRGEAVDYGKTRGLGSNSDKSKTRVSHPASYTGGTLYQPVGCSDDDPGVTACASEEIQGNPQYISPITDTCQANYIVMLTDGAASYNSSSSKIEAMIAKSCVGSGNQKCGHEIVKFLNEEDQITTGMDNDQTIKTYTIGFNFSSQWLRDMATEGGGSFYTADTASQLKTAFDAILREVADTESSFVSPATAVNQFNRLKHNSELYFAMFKPDDDPKWSGNLKRYGINNNQIVDANGDLAVDTATGFFKESAISLWSAAVDGKDVRKGGAANELTSSRNVYTYTGSYPITEAVSLTSHPLSYSNALITKGLLDISSETDAYRTDLLKWASGIDVKDADGDSSTTDARTEMGDPIHSKPVLVTYGGTSTSPDITLYMATNEGYLTAIDTDDGSEVFSFVPKELLPNLRLFYDNLSSTPHPYGLDGDITIWRNDANDDGVISTSTAGDFVYLYVGMRRGGKNYYALDVTDRSQPKLMWTIHGGSGDFSELAQTWSKPVRGKIKLNGIDKNVLIFGGGYDVDQDDATIPVTDDEGRALYIVDAQTGERLWWASLASADLVLTDMDYSLPADVRAVDSDQDGYSDTLFIGDMHGQIWRFDIDNENNSGAANLVAGGVIGAFGGNDEANNRRFYNAIDVSMIRYGGALYYSLGIGSGFRAHPLNKVIKDRFYLLRDPNVEQKPSDYAAYKATESDLYDATMNLVGEGANKATESALFKSRQGWYIKLNEPDASYIGEKVLAESITYKNQLLFTTYTPAVISTTEACAASQLGTSRVYSISVFDATPTANRDGSGTEDNLVRSDRSQALTKSGISPKVTIVLTDENGGDGAMALSGTDLIDGLDLEPIQKTYWKQKSDSSAVVSQ